MGILPALLPLFERPVPALNGPLIKTEIDVAFKLVLIVIPFAFQQRPGIPINDVVFEGETAVRFLARATDLGGLAESEDVISNHVFAAIMLVEAAVLGAVDEVVFDQDVAAAFVRIDAPAAVTVLVARNIVANIAALDRAGLHAQRIDASHVTQHSSADIMNKIELDQVVARRRGPVAPRPTCRNAGVKGVIDFVVANRVPGALANPDSHRGRIDDPNIVNVIV